MVIQTLKTCYFEDSEGIITKFKSQALLKSNINKLVGVATRPPENCLLRSKNRLVAMIYWHQCIESDIYGYFFLGFDK